MREVKFRAWDGLEKRMIDGSEIIIWGHGSFGAYREGNEELSSDGDLITQDPYTDKDMVLMQFTGLRDKNGKEIYEGDVVNYFGHCGEPRMFITHTLDHRYHSNRGGGNDFLSSFCYTWADDDECFHMVICNYNRPSDFSEVIGDIYSTPELLKWIPSPRQKKEAV